MLLDLICLTDEAAPVARAEVLCRTQAGVQVTEVPDTVESLHECIWDGSNGVVGDFPTLSECKDYCAQQILYLEGKYTRIDKPEQYNVYLSEKLYQVMSDVMAKEDSSTSSK